VHDKSACSTALKQPYPFNTWYVGALSSELGRFLFPRTLLGLPVVFYRTEQGRAMAAFGICPHRGYPLKSGALTHDGIKCGYHGLIFDTEGTCRKLLRPGVGTVRSSLRMFPVVERGPLVWVWLGDPGLAKPATIPRTADLGVENTGWRVDCSGYLNVRGRHQLLCDNLLDSAHIDFIHSTSLERAPLIFGAAKIASHPTNCAVSRESLSNDAAKFAFLLPGITGEVDIVMASEFRGPGLIVAVQSHFYRSVASGEPRELIAEMAFAHALTPGDADLNALFPTLYAKFPASR
jgi:nitrite reductase/ring-hydroxylating ferredoxin subunit